MARNEERGGAGRTGSLCRALSIAILAAGAQLAARSLGAQPVVPRLAIEAPDSLASDKARLERFDFTRLDAVARLVGLERSGPAIRVLLVPEDSPIARTTAPWIAGFTRGWTGVIVLFPARTPSYPHDSIDALLQHEVAHVLVARAAGGRPLPRWFHEGVALVAERAWGFGDQARFVYEIAWHGRVPIADLDGFFDGSRASVTLAYSVAGAFVQDLIAQDGPGAPARLLAALAGGESFDEAFREVTGTSVADASDAFWNRRRAWVVWLPWLTSPGAVYSFITMLALIAALRVRARRAARRREAAVEDAVESSADPPTIH